MGRVFEKRKHKIFARAAKMSKLFTKYGREIAIAVKASGSDPDNNSKLRAIIANAKNDNMPKDRIDAAINRAANKDEKAFEEIVYEGYAMKGIGLVVECATDNPTRTVANVRMYFNRAGGELGKTGSLDFTFERKGVFIINKSNHNPEDLELELIDFGLEDIEIEGDELSLTTAFQDFGSMQKALEERKIEIISAELQRIPNNLIEVSEEEQQQVLTLIEKLEDDDDVQKVFHNMKLD